MTQLSSGYHDYQAAIGYQWVSNHFLSFNHRPFPTLGPQLGQKSQSTIQSSEDGRVISSNTSMLSTTSSKQTMKAGSFPLLSMLIRRLSQEMVMVDKFQCPLT